MRHRSTPNARAWDSRTHLFNPRKTPAPAALLALACVLVAVACNDSAAPFMHLEPWFKKGPSSSGLCAEPGSMGMPSALPPSPTVVAGKIADAFSVTSEGSVVYSMPLEVVPGRGSMQPSLSVMYDSAADEGWLGHGFTVTGFSFIARCPKNLAQDGDIEPVRDAEGDALCLDGRRLVPVDPASDKPTEFRTVPDTFTKVVAEYAPGWDPARGPTSFRTYSKGGLILDYGSTDSGLVLSKNGVVRAWLKTAARDRSGSWIGYTYRNDKDPAEGYTVEHAPLRIDYTGHDLAPPSRAVVFEYSKREKADTRVLFARGMALKRSLRLDKIKMLGPGDALVREYKFAFTIAPSTKRTLLEQVEECAADKTCKPATRFTWHHGPSAGFVSIQTPIQEPESERASAMLADVTGDGLDDLILGDVDMTGGSEQPVTNFIIAPNKGQEVAPSFFDTSSLAHQITHYNPPIPVQPDRGTPLDYDHNGLADVFLHDIHGQFTTWRVLLANPDQTFSMLDTGLSRPYAFGAAPPQNLATWDASAHLADVSGDGMPDLIECVYTGVDHAWAAHFWVPDGPGFEVAPSAIPELKAYPCNAELHPIDIDLDGKTDLVVQGSIETANGAIFTEEYDALSLRPLTGSWERTPLGLPHVDPVDGRLLWLDANGDGLPDAVETGFGDGQPRTFFNTGRRFRGAVLSLPAPVIEADKFAKLAAPIDWNADGRQDLLIPIPNPGSTPAWKILQSTGSIEDGTFTIKDPLIPFEAQVLDETVKIAAPVGPRVTDVDGDGIQDVMISLGGHFHVFKNKLFEEDLLATVTDGLRALEPNEQGFLPNVQITYDHLIDRAKTVSDSGSIPSVPAEARTYLPRDHAPDGACAYPIRCVVGPRRVVSGYQLNAGRDKPRSFQVVYRNGRFDRLGRGSLGFGTRIVRDLDTGSGTAELYDNETFDANLKVFPFAGLVEHEWRWSPTLTRPEDPPKLTLELLFTHTYREAIPTTGGQTYFARLAGERKRREQAVSPPLDPFEIEEEVRTIAENETADVLSDTKRIVPDFDLYGNPLEELLFTEGADSELLIKRTFEVDEVDWLVGQLTKQTECSTVSGLHQCRTTERAYDDLGRLKREEASGEFNDPDTKLVVKLARDAFGNVKLLAREDGFGEKRVECTTFDAEGIFPYAHTNAAGHTSYMRFDQRLGELEVLVDPNGLITKWAYDGFGRLTQELRPDGTATTYALTRTKDGGPQQNAWNLKLRTISLGMEDDTVELDPLGRPVRWWTQGVEINGKAAQRVMQEVVFDPLGERVTRRSVPTGELTPLQDIAYDQLSYDGVGRVTKHVTAWNAVTTYRYIGRKVEVHGPSGALTVIENDPLGRPVTIKDPEGGITSYTYGPFGTLRTVTDPDGAVTITERDAYGRVRKQTSPDQGTTEAHYNGFDEQRSALDAENRLFKFYYDPLGRMVMREDGGELTTWTYDTAPHGVGQLAKVESPAGDTTLSTYDAFGRPDTTEKTINGQVYASKVEYDKHGRPYKLTYPQPNGFAPFVVQSNFDPYGHVLAVRDALTQDPYWTLLATDSAGRTTQEEFGKKAAQTTRTYFEEKERVKSIVTMAGGKKVQGLSYFYDKRLNLLSRTDTRQGKTENFSYDLLDRLKSAQFSPGLMHPTTYSYSPGGNLLKRSGVGAYTYDPNRPHIVDTVNGEQFVHDAVGNQVARPGATITYTPFDLPATITQDGLGTVTFQYDGHQQRIRKVTPSAETVYFGGLYERITPMDPKEPVEHRYSVYNGERLVASVTRKLGAEETRFVHVDHLGSVDVLTDEAGAEKERRSYDAFGARRSPVWSFAQPPPAPASGTAKGFTGHEGDEELGLINMRGRMLDPKLGRFLTPDPIVSRPHFGQSWHPFAYAFNSPLNYVDPSGFQVQELAPNDQVVSWPDGKPITVYVIGEPRKKDPPKKAAEDGATLPPTDLGVVGNTAGVVPEQPPTSTELPRSGSDIALDVGLGVGDGLFDLTVGVGTTLLLNAVTLGGYSTYQVGVSMWQGYKESGLVGAINVLNPLYAIARGAVETYQAAEKGDYRAAGSHGAVTAVVTVTTFSGIIQGLRTLAGNVSPGAGAAAPTKATASVEASAAATGAKRGPKPWPEGAHNQKIANRIDELETQGYQHLRGGFKREEVVNIRGGHKLVRRPDITMQRPDGSLYRENVGRTTSAGNPVPREVRALDDLERALGERPGFTPYDR